MSLLSGHPARAVLAVLLWAVAVTPAAADGSPAAPAWTARPATGGSHAAVEGSPTAANGSGPSGDRPYIYLEGAPGTVLEDSISVTNPGRTPLTVRLRGTGAYDASERTGSWLRLASATVTVPARTRADVPFTVTVPQAAPPGDRPGAILTSSGGSGGSGGREVAVRVQLRVSGPTLAALSVEDVDVSGHTIRYTLVNRGNATLRPRVAVDADGLFGTLLRRTERPLDLALLPGQRVKLTEPWRDAPALDSVTVRLRATAAGKAHDGASGASGASGVRSEASASAVYVPGGPLTGGVLLLLAGASVAAGTYRLRRGPRQPPANHEGPGQQTTDDRHLAKAGADA